MKENIIHKMTLDINTDTHSEFKSICAMNRLSMKEVIIEKIEEFINEMKKKTKTKNNLKED